MELFDKEIEKALMRGEDPKEHMDSLTHGPSIPVVIQRKLAENREREAYQLLQLAVKHLAEVNDYWEQCSTDLRLLDEVN